MDDSHRSLRFGLFVILCALTFRLSSRGFPLTVIPTLAEDTEEIYIDETKTGQDVRSFDSQSTSAPTETQPSPQTEPTHETEPPAAAVPEIRNTTAFRPDTAALLEQELGWEQLSEVLILHTHATESYTSSGEGYRESSHFRTQDDGFNMLSIGDAVAAGLEERGITVYHDRTLHDYPSYTAAYVHARSAIRDALEAHPDIGIVLDIHRDAVEESGRQMRTACRVEDETSAQLMMVVGSDTASRRHPHWQENLALALQLQAILERKHPGITRPALLRPARYNQDLSPGAIIVEVGSAGNTHAEAMLAAGLLADAVAELVCR